MTVFAYVNKWCLNPETLSSSKADRHTSHVVRKHEGGPESFATIAWENRASNRAVKTRIRLRKAFLTNPTSDGLWFALNRNTGTYAGPP